MAKRQTDTEKWSDPWFSELSKDGKLLWLWLVDNCNHAGIWKVHFKDMRYFTGSDHSDDQIKELFNDRYHEFRPGKWFIPKFLLFQYPKGLNSNKPAIISVREQIILNGLIDIVHKELGNDYLIIKNDSGIIKDKNNNKSNDIRKSKEQFIAEVIALKTPSNADHIRQFISYWTETDDSGMMRFQKEQFFEIRKRLQTWIQRANNRK